MRSLLAVVLLATCVAADELELRALVAAETRLGPPLDTLQVWPGQVLFLRCEIAGVWRDYRDHIAVRGGLQLLDLEGREVFAADNVVERRGVEPYAAETLPCALSLQLAALTPGPYDVLVRFDDLLADARVSDTLRIFLRPTEAHVANVRLSADARGNFERAGGFERGETFFLCARLLGLARGSRLKESVELVERLPSGEELSRGLLREASWEVDDGAFQPYRLRVPCTRAGEFRILVRLDLPRGDELSFSRAFTITD